MPASPENPETDVDTPIYLHAELLPNIRHITLYVSLPANLGSQNVQPLIALSGSRQAVSVSLPKPFDHVTDTIKLPARVNEASRRILATGRHGAATSADNGPHTPRREFSFRMQIDDSDDSLPRQDALVDDFVPSTAADMSAATRLRCRGCQNVVLDTPGRCADTDADTDTGSEGWTWKDLPSGNWAEMMDFWHCHKPDPPDGHEEDPNAQTKGYGAPNQVVATAGTVLVDVATFLVSEADCKALKKVQPSTEETAQKKEISLNCANCNATIGIEDTIAQGWRLFKTSLSASISPPSSPSTWETHPIETIVAAQLLELIERESARRFVIHCDRPNGLLLWVFNPDFRYSSSSAEHRVSSQRAMKVLFQEIGDVDGILNPGGRSSSLSLEEVRVPESVYDAIEQNLKARNEMLPASAREFREWRVGALHRFERIVGE